MNISQINQCSFWGSNSNPLREKISFNKSKKNFVKNTGISELFEKFDLTNDTEVECTNKMNVYSTKYKKDWFVVLNIDKESQMPTFGEIINIYV